jgi:hypothetical protein
MNRGGRNHGHAPFYTTLVVNDLMLHNCMLDKRIDKCDAFKGNESVRIKDHSSIQKCLCHGLLRDRSVQFD